ncbi:zinc finger MYM-type protein 2-like [Mytilus trossulus]|uniref:zinc finger MYM-type protein 2-like n=1 Tax=Mytilus trossulus TaxID=6551 RepID=UPI003004929C
MTTKRWSNSSIQNIDDAMDALVEDYFHYDDLSNREAEYIKRNLADVNGEGNLILEEVDSANFNFPNEILQDIENAQNHEIDESDKENSSSSKRFRSVTDEDTDSFLALSVNKNTKTKTKSDLNVMLDFFISVGEMRDSVEIPAKDLDSLLSRFFLGVLKKNGDEYEPDSLSSMFNSLDRHLKDSKSSISIKKDPEFNHTRRVLEAKRKALKSLGKGSKPNRAEPLTTEEIQILREKGVIGTQNPDALLNAVFLNNATYFGLRGRQDYVNMTWGDVKLKVTSDGKEYLEFNERSTKTRSGAKSRDFRDITPKIFGEGGSNCPIHVYKEYKRHRPQDTLTDEHRFYLRPLDNKHEEIWYTRQTIGKDKLGKMVKNMAEKGDLQGRKVNHSGRKTFATTLLQNGRPANEVAQLGGWKGISTLTHYSVPSIEQQQQASHTISKVMLPNSDLQTTSDSEEPCELSNSNTLVHNNLNANVSNTNNQTANKHDNPMAMFAGATITGGVFNINIYSGERKNTINCSQEL